MVAIATADYVWERGMYGGQVMLEALGYVNDVANYIAAVKGEAADRSPISSAVGTMELCEEILRQIRADSSVCRGFTASLTNG